MQKGFHLGLDLDGTLADHTAAKLRLAHEMGFMFAPHQTASEVMQRLMPREHYRELQRRLYTEMVDESPIVEAVRETLEALARRGWQFSVVSRRGADARDSARSWLARELSDLIAHDHIFFVDTDDAKDTVCATEGIIAFVDDQRSVLEVMHSVSSRILFDPHGNFPDTPPQTIAMRTWRDLPRLLSVFTTRQSKENPRTV